MFCSNSKSNGTADGVQRRKKLDYTRDIFNLAQILSIYVHIFHFGLIQSKDQVDCIN